MSVIAVASKNKSSFPVLFMAAGLSAIYGFPNMKGVFYSVIQNTLYMDDGMISLVFSVFGAVSIVSYIVGGLLTDKISARIIMIAALLLSAGLHLLISFRPSFGLVLILSGSMAVAAVMLYYPATSKILNTMGSKTAVSSAGRLFGIYYALEGVFSMCINLLGRICYAYMPDDTVVFCFMTRLFAVVCLGIAIMMLLQRNSISVNNAENSRFSVRELKNVVKDARIWYIAVIILGIYFSFAAVSYIAIYLQTVFGYAGGSAITISIIRVNLLTIFAGSAFGAFCKKTGSTGSVLIKSLPLIMIVAALIIINGFVFKSGLMALITTMIFTFMVVGLKTIMLSLVSEAKISQRYMGTATGVASFVGYSPDAFLFLMMGMLLTNIGSAAYGVMFILCLAGLAASFISYQMLRRRI